MERNRASRVWIVEDARFDEARRELNVGGQRRNLEAKPLALLHTLLCRAGEVATKDELLRTVWPGVMVTEGSLTTAVSKLRAALGPRGRVIVEPVHGVGYRIGVPIELAASTERARLAFTLREGEPVPNRPQWLLERRLAASEVWLVRHDKTAERRVFKFADTAERLEDLKREAALCRVLYAALGDRADLVRPIEWNFDNRPWYIESPFGGLDLPAWAAGAGGLAAVPLGDRVALVATVARTVAAAHQVGVLHRDIKPANILLAPSDGPGARAQARLVDFGAGSLTEAARLQAAAISGLGLTTSVIPGSDRRQGTLRYMAPEILAGGSATMASDVYALGIVLYQLTVADLDRPLAAGWEADIDDPLIRDDIATAAAGNPARRLASAALLAERLETLAERADLARRRAAEAKLRTDLARRLERIRARRPWLVLAGASLVLGSIAVGIAATRAARSGFEARREAGAARAINLFLTDDLLARADPFQSGHAEESLVQAATRAEGDIAKRFGDEPLIGAEIHAALAQAFNQRTEYDAARNAYKAAIAEYERAQGAGSPDATILRLRWALMEGVIATSTQPDRAVALVEAARPRFPSLGKRRAEADTWLAYAEGTIDLAKGDSRQGRLDYRRAADLADSMPSVFRPEDVFKIRRAEALTSTRLGEWATATAELDTLSTRVAAAEGVRSAEYLLLQLNKAQVLLASGAFLGAAALLDRIYPDFLTVYGPQHRLTVILVGDRAEAMGQLGRYDEAIRDDTVLYRAATAQRGPGSFESTSTGSDLALYQCRAGRIDAGLQTSRDIYQATLRRFGPGAALTGEAAGSYAFCLIEGGRQAEAEPVLDSIDVKLVGQIVEDPNYQAQVDLMRAAITAKEGDGARARALIAAPLRVFHQPKADPYLRAWTDRLAGALGTVDADASRP